MIGIFENFLHNFKRLIDPAFWIVRIFYRRQKRRVQRQFLHRGLILIQIDGLGQNCLQQAMDGGYMPFTQKLIRQEHYKNLSLYSGLPSNTPAFQGEFFWGIKQCVPAFQFKDRSQDKIYTMFQAESATKIEISMSQRGKPLLKRGSCYGNIFSGGAKEAHFCATTLSWIYFRKSFMSLKWVMTLLLNAYLLIKVPILLCVEFFLALKDAIHGALKRQDFLMEAMFIVTRLVVSIGLREVITAFAKVDIIRALPIIQVNYFGYDEQSHRRGPNSRFAMWSLKGIDDHIKELWTLAHESEKRNYEVIIYSDHGQEYCDSFVAKEDKTLYEKVQELLQQAPNGLCQTKVAARTQTGEWDSLARMFQKGTPPCEKEVFVSEMGPIGHIYFATPLDDDAKKYWAERIVSHLQVPNACFRASDGESWAFASDRKYRLPQEGESFLGYRKPYTDELVQDLTSLLAHPYSGDIVCFGWSPGKKAMTFPKESGSHASLGPEETQAFALVPHFLCQLHTTRAYIRPLDLREIVQNYFRKPLSHPLNISSTDRFDKARMRIMSYNIHYGRGMDRRASLDRISQVIRRHDPDIVGLQEVDLGGSDNHHWNQAAILAAALRMHYFVFPIHESKTVKKGIAILTRYLPDQVVTEPLPSLKRFGIFEKRGVLWLQFKLTEGRTIWFGNTHLSYWPNERNMQINEILQSFFIQQSQDHGLILCGDFNVHHETRMYRRVRQQLKDVELEGTEKMNTWFGRHPFWRLDHVFFNDFFNVQAASVPRSFLERKTSDHLPIIADLTHTSS